MTTRGTPRWAVAMLAVAVLVSACSSDDDPTDASPSTTRRPARQVAVEPAHLEGPIAVGDLSPPADPRAVDLAAVGYTQEEFFASGTATAYALDGTLRRDGRWKVQPTTTAPYKTRFLVRRPSDPARFNGTVVVEWLNVTVVEASPEWAYTSKVVIDAGAAWVGVSVQALGVVGGAARIQTGLAEQTQTSGGIRGSNPARYGTLAHPGDAYAFDIYSQIGAAIRSPGRTPLLGSRARRVIAAGESQSAAYLTGYINAIQPVSDVFDGFFVHSRGAGAAHPDGSLDIRGSTTARYRFRPDLGAPVLAFETETDVGPLLRYATAAQPDNARLRIWEVAGTSHADAYLVGGSFPLCPAGINDGPQHLVAKAAMTALLRWVERDEAPPHAPRIETDGPDGVTVVRDEHGIARGGIRTPSVDVPTRTLSAEVPEGAPVLCALFGTSKPFDAAKLRSLYRSRQAYLDAFDRSLDRAVRRGFVRRSDRAEFAAEARAVAF